MLASCWSVVVVACLSATPAPVSKSITAAKVQKFVDAQKQVAQKPGEPAETVAKRVGLTLDDYLDIQAAVNVVETKLDGVEMQRHSLREMEELLLKVPEQKSASIRAEVTRIKARIKDMEALTDLRQRFGSAEVDLIVSKLPELHKIYASSAIDPLTGEPRR